MNASCTRSSARSRSPVLRPMKCTSRSRYRSYNSVNAPGCPSRCAATSSLSLSDGRWTARLSCTAWRVLAVFTTAAPFLGNRRPPRGSRLRLARPPVPLHGATISITIKYNPAEHAAQGEQSIETQRITATCRTAAATRYPGLFKDLLNLGNAAGARHCGVTERVAGAMNRSVRDATRERARRFFAGGPGRWESGLEGPPGQGEGPRRPRDIAVARGAGPGVSVR